MSADSLAMSTAVSTLIPTSAACSAGASLMPSPMKPTVCLRDCRAWMIRCLWAGETRANSVVFSAASASSLVGHLLDVGAQQDELGREPDLLADLAGDEIVVAGDDLDRDAVALQRLDGRRGGLLGRVEERDVAVQDQVALVGLAVGRGVAGDDAARLDVLAGDGQHAEAVGAQPLVLLLQLLDEDAVHRERLAVELELLAAREDRLGRALGDDAVLALGRADDDRHDAALEVEGDLVDLGVVGDVRLGVGLLVGQHRAVEDVLQARLEVAVEVRQRQHAVVLAQHHVAVPLQDDLVHASACRSCRCRARPSRPGSGSR